MPERRLVELPESLFQALARRAAEGGRSVDAEAAGLLERCLDDAAAGQPTLEARVREHTEELQDMLLVLRDELARRERTEAELRRSNADLEQFASVASHDLQEPLRMVVSYLQLLERRYKGRLDEAADEFIAYAVDGGRRMQTLIEDFLTYSRVGRGEARFQEVDVGAVLGQTIKNLQVAIEESGARVLVDPLPTISADPGQLAVLFQNLLANAIKFRGSAPPEVRVSAERQKAGWQFVVRDNGIGIAPEFQERIFALFRRLHGRDEYAGTGIGLAVARKVVERHGGRIWVESTPGQGAAFYFTIPDHLPEPAPGG